jgi:hypothetical protein
LNVILNRRFSAVVKDPTTPVVLFVPPERMDSSLALRMTPKQKSTILFN